MQIETFTRNHITVRVAGTAAKLWIEFVNDTKSAKYMPELVRSPYDTTTEAGATNIRLAIYDALTVEVKSFNDIYNVLDLAGIQDRSGSLDDMAERIADSDYMQRLVLKAVAAR